MSHSVESIEAALRKADGTIQRVKLRATVAELRGSGGVEDAEVARVELESEAADGVYQLEYFYMRPHSDQVRVQDGALVAL